MGDVRYVEFMWFGKIFPIRKSRNEVRLTASTDVTDCCTVRAFLHDERSGHTSTKPPMLDGRAEVIKLILTYQFIDQSGKERPALQNHNIHQ
jgi:hypothetical protein